MAFPSCAEATPALDTSASANHFVISTLVGTGCGIRKFPISNRALAVAVEQLLRGRCREAYQARARKRKTSDAAFIIDSLCTSKGCARIIDGCIGPVRIDESV